MASEGILRWQGSIINLVTVFSFSFLDQPACLRLMCDPRSAAYVASWDEWRNAGVNLVPVFKEDNNEDLVPLMAALIERPNGLAGLLGGADLGKVSVLLSVAKGIRSAALSKLMINEGVRPECMLFCDFYGKPNV